MSLHKEKKETIIKEFQQKAGDTGSVEVQIALLTTTIRQLTEHFKTHPKDFNSKRGLLKMVSQRKSFLRYLQRTNPTTYQTLVEKLEIRK